VAEPSGLVGAGIDAIPHRQGPDDENEQNEECGSHGSPPGVFVVIFPLSIGQLDH
jgi:hypothetical protein